MSDVDIPPVTEEERAAWPSKPMVALEKPFKDIRGTIQPLVDEIMQSAVLIDSKKGSVRANHYHKTDWHYCYVLAGMIEYYHRPTGADTEPECIKVNAGEMVFTPPMVDHGMVFPEDTVFLTLSRNPRDQETYEADVVRIAMLSTVGLKSWKPDE
jgi:quercetin dioxygenase-like cupin family protein